MEHTTQNKIGHTAEHIRDKYKGQGKDKGTYKGHGKDKWTWGFRGHRKNKGKQTPWESGGQGDMSIEGTGVRQGDMDTQGTKG